MVDVDHNKNIQRIVDVIKADTEIFDNGETLGKLRSVQFGEPPAQEDKHFEMPYAYVTTRETIQVTKYPFGITSGGSISSASFQYEVTLVAQKRDKQVNSEKLVYDLAKLLRNTLEANPTFIDPNADPVGPPIIPDDPIFTRSVINEVQWDRESKGQMVTIVKFVLLATIGKTSSIIIDFPDLENPPEEIAIEIPLLSIPTNEEGEEWDADRIQNGDRVITGKGDFGNMYLEYETNETLDAQIRAKIDIEEVITLTINDESRMINVYYADRNITHSFDAIPRAVLHLEIVKV